MKIQKRVNLTGKDGEQFSVNLTIRSHTPRKLERISAPEKGAFYQSHLYDCQQGHSTTYYSIMEIYGGKVQSYGIVPVGLEEWPEVQYLLSQGEDIEDIKRMSFEEIDEEYSTH